MFKTIITVIAISLYATAAFAVDGSITTPPAALKGYAQSKNVGLVYGLATNNVACTGVACDTWAAATQHASGDKNYYTSNAYGGLGVKVVTPGSAIGTVPIPASSTDSTLPTAWTKI